MSIAIIFNSKATHHWEAALKQHLPETKIEVYPEIEDFAKVDMALCWKAEENVLDLFPNLQLIHSVGAAVDHITLKQNIKLDQTICRIVDDYLSADMFEFLLAIVMTEIKNLPLYQQLQTHQNWKPRKYKRIQDTQLCILGLGEIGAFAAQQFAQMGFQTKGWSQTKKALKNVTCFAGAEELNAAVADVDFLINILPVTLKTTGILNQPLFDKLAANTILINVGRGEHLVDKDLLTALNSAKLQSAYLDVFQTEPLPKDHPFWTHPKIKITPHIASVTQIDSAVLLVVENYKNYLSGLPLKHIASVEKGY
ncbi:MAG: glyoxylate/hydroxypyruvate reductase A [Sphingobacteriales bacterium]|nr:glyoxylate/hydroxypyruvate reductase A [Sphingobacteriales bacterium]